MSESRRGAANPSFKDGRRVGESVGRRRFHSAAYVCGFPDCTQRGAHQHHVVYRQELRRRHLDEWDSRDAFPLCHSHHSRHHHGHPLPLAALLDRNLDYAFEVLGSYAYDYLKRRYRGDDPRLEERLHRAETQENFSSIS